MLEKPDIINNCLAVEKKKSSYFHFQVTFQEWMTMNNISTICGFI